MKHKFERASVKKALIRVTVMLALVQSLPGRPDYPLPPSHPLVPYFKEEARSLINAPLSQISTREDWEGTKESLREQFQDSLGLLPLPERTPLNAEVTRRLEHPEFTVEMIHFQASPGLYVTGNLYIPKGLEGPVPTILYVCGHSRFGHLDGVRYGNKVAYQHHGIWFAQNGYVAFVIDTIHRGEIAGIHHGTFNYDMWWWKSRGYTSAGIEAWTSMRAIDYLESRPEVDRTRIGMTGRSGGGAYSWWLPVIDNRIAATVPVAGITDLWNHVVDGVVQGHCDCMYPVNTYRWDFPVVAALIAPRPLLLSNTDRDAIYPLDGVVRLYQATTPIYEMHDARENLGLLITPGPHRSDGQELQLPALRWFNRHFKNDTSPVTGFAERLFEHHELKVFDTLPADSINAEIHYHFVPMAEHQVSSIESREDWDQAVSDWKDRLMRLSFRGWPDTAPERNTRYTRELEQNGIRAQEFHFTSQKHVDLQIWTIRSAKTQPERVRMRVLSQEEWNDDIFQLAEDSAFRNDEILILFAPRGVGPSSWDDGDQRRQVHIRRRFMIIGQTVDSMRVWDIRQAIQNVSENPQMNALPLEVEAAGEMAVNALYATFFEPSVSSATLMAPTSSHMQGPAYLNVLRVLDIPQVLAATASRTPVVVKTGRKNDWQYATGIMDRFNFPSGSLQIVDPD